MLRVSTQKDGRVGRRERPYLVMMVQGAFRIRGEVTQNLEIQEVVWLSPLPLNQSAHTLLPFCGLILNKLFASDSNELLPND